MIKKGMVKNWSLLFGGGGCLVFGSCSSITGDFHMSNYGLYLTGTHARICGLLLVILGGHVLYCAFKKGVDKAGSNDGDENGNS